MAAAKRKNTKAANPIKADKPEHTRNILNPRQRAAALAVSAAFMQWVWVQPSWAAAPSEPTSNLPTGGKWANNPDGTAGGTINTPSATQMQLNQNQRGGVIDFNCFCSRQGTLVNLTAPTTDSTTLIRSQEGANLWGRFTANDNVFISSAPGVYFSRTASVEVGSLVATSLSITNADFFAGRYNFYREANSNGSVVNDGNIQILNLGGYAALAGPQVQNNGVIVASAGNVTLAAGDRVTLDMVGDGLIKVSVDAAALNALALNAGTIQADGGRVVLTARGANALLDTVINNTGVIRARSLVARNGEIVLDGGSAGTVANSGTLDASGTDAGTTGGTVKVLGQYASLDNGTRIDVSGDAGGGLALIGGNFHGAGPEQNSSTTTIAADAGINADATNSGDGGRIAVWSDGATTYRGSVSARGGTQSGDGGFAEISGKHGLDLGNVRTEQFALNARAAGAKGGSLLFDPNTFTIDDAFAATATAQLNVGTSVNVQTTDSTAPDDNIIFTNSVTPLATGGATLGAKLNLDADDFITGATGSNLTGTNYAALLKISLTSTASKTYDGNATATLAGANFIVKGTFDTDTVGVTQTVGTYTNGAHVAANAAGSPVTASVTSGDLSGAGHIYTVQGNSAAGNIGEITAKTVTLSANKTYDGTTSVTGSVTVGTGIGGEALNYTGATSNDAHVATASKFINAITLQDGTGVATDYQLPTLNAANAPVAITPYFVTATLTNTGETKTYDGTTSTGATATYNVATVLGTDTVNISTGSLVYNSSHVASADHLVASGLTVGSVTGGTFSSVASDYSLTSATANSAASSALVTAKTLTVALNNAGVTKTYDGTTAAPGGFTPTYTPTGLVAGDTAVTITDTGTVYDTAHVATASQVTTSGLSLTAITGGNSSATTDYNLTTASSSVGAAITAKTLTVALNNAGVTKTYDGTTAAPGGFTPTYTPTGLVAGDTAVTITDTGTVYDTAHVATASQVTTSGLSLTAITGGNSSATTDYNLTTASSSVGAAIAPYFVTATLTNTGETKTYDGTTSTGATATYNVATVLGTDTVNISTGSLVYNSSHVASADHLVASGLTVGSVTGGTFSSVASDYSLTSATANSAASSALVTAKTLTVALNNAGVTKTYDGTTAAPGGFTPTYTPTGLVAGDTAVTITDTGTVYDTAHVATASQVTTSGLSLTAITGGNSSATTDYNLTTASSSVGAAITPYFVTATLTNTGETKTYDGTTSTGATATYNVATVLGTDTVNISTGSLVYNSSHVASADHLVASGLTVGSVTGGTFSSVASDYSLTSATANSAASSALVTAKTLTVALNNAGVTKTYDGTTAAPGGFTPTYTPTGLVAGDTAVTITDTGTVYDTAHVATASQVTTSGLSLTAITGGNSSATTDYNLTTASSSVGAAITAKTLTVALNNAGVTKTYDGTTAAPGGFTPTYTPTGLVAGDTAVTITDTGTVYDTAHVATASQVTTSGLSLTAITGGNSSATTDYNLTTASSSVGAAITPYFVTATLTNTGETKTYDGTTSTGATATYNVATVLGTDTVNISTGSLVYNSSHVASADHLVASGLTVGSVTGGTFSSVASDYSLTSATANSAASSALVTAKTLTVALNNAGVTKTYDGTTAAPGGFTPTYTPTGLVAGDTAVTITDTGTVYDTAHVATASQVTTSGLSLTAITGGNSSATTDYNLTTASSSVGAAITPYFVTATLTNTGETKTYDGTTSTGATATYNVATVLGTDTVNISTGSLVYNSSHVASADHLVASGLTVGSVTGGTFSSVASDYSLTSATANSAASSALVTAKTLTVALNNAGVTKTYDGTTAAPGGFTPTYTPTGLVAGDTAVTITDTGTVYDTAHVATASQVTTSGLSLTAITGGNSSATTDYNLTTASSSVLAAITAKTLTVALNNAGVTKTYDGTTAAPGGFTPTYTPTGLVAGDTAVTITDTGTVYDTAHVATASQVTTSGLSLTAITGGNSSATTDYNLTTASSSVGAAITAKTLTVALNNAGVTKTYDGTTAAPGGFTPTYTPAGLIAGDTAVSISDTGTAYDTAHVATATQVTTGGLALTGITGSNSSAATDYNLTTASASAAASITAKTLTVALSNVGVTKTYDATTAAPGGFTPTYTPTGLVAGDTAVTISDTGSAYDFAHVATATQVTTSGLSLTAITGGNSSVASDYNLTTASANVAAAITAKTLTVALSNAGVTKTYDGTTAAPGGFTPAYTPTGLVAGDTAVTISDTGSAYNSPNVVGATQVTTSGLSLTAITGGNSSATTDYNLTTASANVAATITTKPLTAVTLTGTTTKTYDGSNSATLGTGNYSITGFIGGEGATIGVTTGTYNNGKDVVNNPAGSPVTSSTILAGNYTANGGTLLSNYDLTAVTNTTASGNIGQITQLSSVLYVGLTGGNWSVASNWAGNAIPDLGNVASVDLGGKTVNMNLAGVQSTSVGNGSLNLTTGTFTGASFTASLVTYNQTGGSISTSGNISITTSGNLTPRVITSSLGSVTLTAAAILGGSVCPGVCVSGTSGIFSSNADVTGVGVDFQSKSLILTGNASTWTLNGPGTAPIFSVTNSATNIFYNGSPISGAAVVALQQSGSVIGSTLADISRAALLATQDTDSVQKQIAYGFVGDVGTTPPMDHRIDETGISVPKCMNDSREGQTCQ